MIFRSVKFLLSRPNAAMPYEPGYEEDGFLQSLEPLNSNDIELLASNCTEVFRVVFFLHVFVTIFVI